MISLQNFSTHNTNCLELFENKKCEKIDSKHSRLQDDHYVRVYSNVTQRFEAFNWCLLSIIEIDRLKSLDQFEDPKLSKPKLIDNEIQLGKDCCLHAIDL